VKVDAELDDAWIAAVKKGSTREDHTTGYALSSDPDLRSKQLQLRELALKHEQQIIEVLRNSSDGRQRATAATAIGYASQSGPQISALIAASSDPESEVRNNVLLCSWPPAATSTTVCFMSYRTSFYTLGFPVA
jgi:hypothetical protein